MENTEIKWIGGTKASRESGRGNLVSSWKAWASVKYGTLSEGLDTIEGAFGGMAARGNVSRWERGTRRMPAEVVNYMLSDVLPVLLAESTDPEFVFERVQQPTQLKDRR